MSRPRVLDASPLSEFITRMRDAHRRRVAAIDPADKRAIEREMTGLMRTYLGRDAWEATLAAQRGAERTADVPRATSRRRRVRPGPVSRYPDGFDHKLAAAGDRDRDDD